MQPFDCALEILGIPMHYDLPFTENTYHPRTFLSDIFLKKLKRPIKEDLPRFDLWSTYPFCAIVADFDNLPSDFITDPLIKDAPEDWNAFRDYLHWRYGHLGLVLSSPSEKAKILFKVFLPLDQDMTLEIAHETLDYLLDGSERVRLDREPEAARRFFVNQTMYQDMREGLEGLPMHAAILDSVDDKPDPMEVIEEKQSPFVWNLLSADAPELDRLEGLLRTRGEWFLARFIGGSAKAGLENIALGQIYLAEQSAIHLDKPLSQTVMFNTLQAFIQKGLLERVDEQYQVGRFSMRYRALGVLRSVLEEVLVHAKERRTRVIPLVTVIKDGEWERVLWQMTNYFGSESAYLAWAFSLPGIDTPGKKRKKKAERAWAAHIDPSRNKRRVA